MKMPERIDEALFAPCGMNCLVCYRHCDHKRPCVGCLPGERGKPEHCRACAIRDCVRTRGISHCHACGEYPCKRIKNLERSYRTRYHASLMENSERVRTEGMEAFMASQRRRYACPDCGGVISIHGRVCSECGKTVEQRGE